MSIQAPQVAHLFIASFGSILHCRRQPPQDDTPYRIRYPGTIPLATSPTNSRSLYLQLQGRAEIAFFHLQGSATFFVRVAGDSMIGAGIHHNDILMVDRSLEPTNGKVVIAVVNGELTVKRLVKNGAKPKQETSPTLSNEASLVVSRLKLLDGRKRPRKREISQLDQVVMPGFAEWGGARNCL